MATKRLIDANKIKYRTISYGGWGMPEEVADKFDIDKMPTVDAVEVVRCKDCKYAENMMPINNSNGVLMGDCTLRKEDDIIVIALEDEFCSYGERKDNEDNT